MRDDPVTRAQGEAVAWPLTLAAAALLGTVIIACMMPFVAIATVAAATMSRAQAVTAVIGVWAVNQVLGFGALGYPLTAHALMWGVALCAASIAALFVTRRVIGGAAPSVLRLASAFAAAFIVYEGLLYALSLVEGGGSEMFTPQVVLSILLNDAVWLAVLTAMHAGLLRLAPQVFGPAPALRLR